MNKLYWMAAAVALPLAAMAQDATTSGTNDKAAARAERRANGVEAARSPEPGEGTPIPDPTAKVPRDERKAAAKARRAEMKQENKAGELAEPGEAGLEDSGTAAPKAKVTRAERQAARAARRAEMARENKAGELKEPGDNYPGK